MDACRRQVTRSGFVVLDKPAGLSSARALDAWRPKGGRRRSRPRIGHAGTLDPFATGVLLVLLGEATRFARMAMGLPKTYRATVRFGIETDTLDPTGEVVRIADAGPVAPPALDAAIAAQLGSVTQAPPAFSALRVDGTRAYRLARAGESPRLAARTVRIDSIAIRQSDWPEVTLDVVCGAGTYLRALARDLGAALGLPASLRALRRTAIGPFVAAPEAPSIRPLIDLLTAAGIPSLHVDSARALRFAQGNAIPGGGDGPQVAVVHGGEVVGVGRVLPGGDVCGGLVLRSARESLEADNRIRRG